MPILGGNRQHKHVNPKIESSEIDRTHKHYAYSDDIASQLLEKEAFRTTCEISEKPDKSIQLFLKKFKKIFLG